MKRLTFAAPIAILAAVLAGCASPGPRSPASATMTPQQVPYWAGTGVVQSVTPAPGPVIAGPVPAGAIPSRNPATAGATSESGMQRLRIRMDDGRMLWVDTASREFQPGMRVQLSDNNQIRRL